MGKAAALTRDVDLYRIDFKNKSISNGLGGTAAAFVNVNVNVGGAAYQGVEAQATWLIGSGLAAYANGSVNRVTTNDAGKQISAAPNMTAALGALYNAGPWGASLPYKRIGAAYQKEYAANPATDDDCTVAADGNVDLGLSYTLQGVSAIAAKSLKLQLNVFNLANRQAVTAISPDKSLAGDQYTYQVPRSLQVSAKAFF